MATESTTVTELEKLLAAIGEYDDPRRASTEWKQAYRLLQKTDLPSGRVTHVVGMRDVSGLGELIEQLRAPGEATPPAEAPSAEECKRAMRAFRKRLALTVLDEQSTLGHGPLSKGATGVAAIVPPSEWPESVWQELVRQGKLRYIGHGFYELAK